MIAVSKSVYKNVVPVIHNQYKDPLLNKKMLEFMKLKKNYYSWFDDKIYILGNEYDRLALGY